jgi:hypothetical protein
MKGWGSTVDVVSFSRPEDEHSEEVPAAEECGEEREGHGASIFLEQSFGRHWERSEEDLPHEEGDYQDDAEDERYEDVDAVPCILLCVNTRSSSEKRTVAILPDLHPTAYPS